MTDRRINLIILGSGGHARVLADCLKSRCDILIHGFLDSDQGRFGKEWNGIRVLGSDTLLSGLSRQGVTHFAVGLGSVGDSDRRRKLYELGLLSGLDPLTIVHPTAVCSSQAKIGEGTQIFPLSIINAGAILGANVIVNSGAIIEHDCIIGDHAHLATGSRLAGGVHVEAGAHIGAGAVVRHSIMIGSRAVVGAGSVVVKDVSAGTVVAGVPARLLKKTDRGAGSENL